MKKTKFSIQNYFDMYKSRGIRLVIEYFFFNHLFDLIYKTNTHSWNKNNLDDPDRGSYMSSWNKDTLLAMEFLKKKFNKFFNSAEFIDIGSGKGKVLIFWRRKYGKKRKVVGIENDKNLAFICNQNFKVLGIEKPEIIINDASKVKLGKKNENKIFYLYNPFGAKILKTFFKKNFFKNSAIIYFNPKYSDQLLNLGYKCIYEKKTYRKGSSFKILISKNLKNFK